MAATEMRVTLPDGSQKVLPAGATAADLAKAIGPGLAKAALAAKVNGEVRDLARPLPDGAGVELLTDKHPQALDVLRHSSAHVLATAVRQLFPHARIGFGPPIEDVSRAEARSRFVDDPLKLERIDDLGEMK